MSRPPDSRSKVAMVLACEKISRSISRAIPVPNFNVLVAADAAINETYGSIIRRYGSGISPPAG